MGDIIITCLRQEIASGGTVFPVLVGFLPAEDLIQIAEAPSFSPTTAHQQIAANVMTKPVKEWQRPLEKPRIQDIRHVFDDSGKLMPNPVLLSENAITQPKIGIKQATVGGGFATPAWEITVPIPSNKQEKPLWILDGQHRIHGLAVSKQKKNSVPLVLLLNTGLEIYPPDLLAEIFAQVTTSAKKLDDLHNEWLTFAFQLEKYSHSQDDLSAMETVVLMCRDTKLYKDSTSNPFVNAIKFNVDKPAAPVSGGFAYSCTDLQRLIQKRYFADAAAGKHLTPPELAREIGRAYLALRKSVTSPNTSVFFGHGDFQHRIMQDAFLIAVLRYLLSKGPPTDWNALLAKLKFAETDWNFDPWKKSLTAASNRSSKNAAISILSEVFQTEALPVGVGNLTEYFRGSNATVELIFSRLTPGGKAVQAGKLPVPLKRADALQRDVGDRRNVRLGAVTSNIGEVRVVDKDSPAARPRRFQLKGKGLSLDPKSHGSPLSMELVLELYGGIEQGAELEIKWET